MQHSYNVFITGYVIGDESSFVLLLIGAFDESCSLRVRKPHEARHSGGLLELSMLASSAGFYTTAVAAHT